MSTAREFLAAVQQRADAATPAPWDRDDRRNDGRVGVRSTATDMGPMRGSDEVCEVGDESMPLVDQDAEFIAAARTDVPRLVAALTAVLDLAETNQYDANQDRMGFTPVLSKRTVRAVITAALTPKENDS